LEASHARSRSRWCHPSDRQDAPPDACGPNASVTMTDLRQTGALDFGFILRLAVCRRHCADSDRRTACASWTQRCQSSRNFGVTCRASPALLPRQPDARRVSPRTGPLADPAPRSSCRAARAPAPPPRTARPDPKQPGAQDRSEHLVSVDPQVVDAGHGDLPHSTTPHRTSGSTPSAPASSTPR
jgi:hypothetical protein